MSTPHTPGPESPFSELARKDASYVRGNQLASEYEARQESWERFANNAELVGQVPELVGRIGHDARTLARELQREDVFQAPGEQPVVVSEAFTTNAVYQTKAQNHTSRHHIEHLTHEKPSRLTRKSKRHKQASDQASFNHLVYEDALREDAKKGKKAAPKGWVFGLGPKNSPVSRFAMLGTDGTLYDVNTYDSGEGPAYIDDPNAQPSLWQRAVHPDRLVPMIKATENQTDVAIGPANRKGSDISSELWRYFPSTKVASALLGIENPLTEDFGRIQQAGDYYFGPQLGPDWRNVADINQLVSAFVAGQLPGGAPEDLHNLHVSILDRMRTLGVLDAVPKELAHLKALHQGLDSLAVGSGKYRRNEVTPLPQPTHAEQEQAKLDTAMQLLPELDNLELALKNASRDPQAEKDYEKNMQRKKHIENLFKQFGIVRIAAETGVTTFDPKYHEAISMRHDSLPQDTPLTTERISKVLRSGFMMGDKVIRPVMVEVGREHLTPQASNRPTHPHGFTGNVTAF